jgi:hypothetical protein
LLGVGTCTLCNALAVGLRVDSCAAVSWVLSTEVFISEPPSCDFAGNASVDGDVQMQRTCVPDSHKRAYAQKLGVCCEYFRGKIREGSC